MADASMNYLYTAGGYAALIGIGFTIYHISQNANNRRGISANKASRSTFQQPRKEDRKKKQRLTNFTSEAKNRAKSSNETSPRLGPTPDSASEDGDDNREFARQFAKAQQGTNLASKAQDSKQREKSVKQSRASKMLKGNHQDKGQASGPSVPSPSAGADAGASTDADADTDENSSPMLSPQLPAVDARGVADILEPTPPTGPSTIRIVDDMPKKQAPKFSKAPEKTETKKQRQNRKKAEASKMARAAAEQERKTLQEQQRRTARIAEGRAAKDGSQSMAPKVISSAWAQGAPKDAAPDNEEALSHASVLHQPLETSSKTNSTGLRSQSSWMSSLPSEEEQMEMLKDEADEWNTVTTRASKRASKKTSSVTSSEEKASKEMEPRSQPPQPAPVITHKPATTASTKQFGGSFSALNTNDENFKEVEEEWEV